jgi:hypothetical protein
MRKNVLLNVKKEVTLILHVIKGSAEMDCPGGIFFFPDIMPCDQGLRP